MHTQCMPLVQTHTHTHMHAHIHTRTHTYAHMHVCTCLEDDKVKLKNVSFCHLQRQIGSFGESKHSDGMGVFRLGVAVKLL